jgi:hypothetical protein
MKLKEKKTSFRFLYIIWRKSGVILNGSVRRSCWALVPYAWNLIANLLISRPLYDCIFKISILHHIYTGLLSCWTGSQRSSPLFKNFVNSSIPCGINGSRWLQHKRAILYYSQRHQQTCLYSYGYIFKLAISIQ